MWGLLFFIASVHSVLGEGKGFINFGGFICPREEKALGECLKDALNSYIPQLATGVPEFNVPSSEPLIIPSLSVRQHSGPIDVTSTFDDVTVSGPSHMTVTNVRVIAKNHQVIARLAIPELKMRGNYKLAGQLLMLPIEGQGKFTAKFGDIDAIVNIVLGRQRQFNGPDTLKCEDLDFKFKATSASMQLDNLFGSDGELSKSMNNFLNENWQMMAEELQGPIEDALRDFFKPLADHSFATLNADDIFGKH
ncbi:hypothetical protein O0L34_g8250 [Tuta absoluta]|nr:hypothetical protein O0L34_g8250 [Tuta absoluta]